jgi:acetyl esterase/lipase
VHGCNDSLVPVVEAAHFAELLAAVSTSPVVYTELPGAQHAFDVFRSVRSAQAAAAVERFCEFVWSTGRRPTAGSADEAVNS